MSVQTPVATVNRQNPAEAIRNNPDQLKQNPELKARAVDSVNKAVEERGVSTVASPENPGVDATTMSAELVDEVSNSQKLNPNADVDSLIQALQGMVQPRVDQHLQQGGQNGAQAVDPVGGAQKEQKQKKAYWSPDTENGMIHEGRDKIGRVDIREETVKAPEKGAEGQSAQNAAKKPQAPRQVAAPGGANGSKATGGGTGGATGTGATGAAGAAGAPKASTAPAPAKQTQPTNAGDDDKETDKVELSPETQQAAQSMANQGIQQPQALQSAAQGGKGDDAGSGSYDVRTRATGGSQSVDVQGAHEVGPGSFFRSFRKLDDSPLLASATLHRRKGADVASELDPQNQGAGKPRPVTAPAEAADPQMLQKLRSPTAD